MEYLNTFILTQIFLTVFAYPGRRKNIHIFSIITCQSFELIDLISLERNVRILVHVALKGVIKFAYNTNVTVIRRVIHRKFLSQPYIISTIHWTLNTRYLIKLNDKIHFWNNTKNVSCRYLRNSAQKNTSKTMIIT